MNCRSGHSSINTSTNQSTGSTTFYDTVTNWESDIIPFPDFDEVESTYLMEQMNEIDLTQQTSVRLNLWGVIRTKISRNFKIKANSLNPFRGNCFGRKNKKAAGNLDSLHIRGGYLELPEALEDSTEIENHSRTPRTSWQANTSARREEGTSLTQVQVKLGALKRSGAIRGRKPRGGLRTANQILESRMVRAYVHSSESMTGRSNGEASGSAGATDPATAPQMKKSSFRNGGGDGLPEAPKQVRFAPSVEVVLEHKACEACEHRTQSRPFTHRYNDEDAPGLDAASASASTLEPEGLSWTQAPSGIRFLSAERVRQLVENGSYALRMMGPVLKRNVFCFVWGEFAEPERLTWLDRLVVGEVRAGLDVDCSWLSGA
jgi:hypothetical protein